MRLPEDVIRYPPLPGVLCSDCFRLPPPGQGAAVYLTTEKLAALGVDDLLPGWHVFCIDAALPACEELVRLTDASISGWETGRSGWHYGKKPGR